MLLSLLKSQTKGFIFPMACRSFATIGKVTSRALPSFERKLARVRNDVTAFRDQNYNVNAYYISKSFDLNALSTMFSSSQVQLLNKDALVVSLESNEVSSFVTFCNFGSAVFFNCSADLISSTIQSTRPHTRGSITEVRETAADDYRIQVDREIETWSQFEPNVLLIQELDMKNIVVISSVIGQSVALSYYERIVDDLLLQYDKATSNPQRKQLLKLLKDSNGALAEIILKLGVLDRTKLRDSVWKFQKYFEVWEGLRDEFEFSDRWAIIDTKTEFLKSNMEFFIDIINTERGESLERIIIVLIAAELFLEIYHRFL